VTWLVRERAWVREPAVEVLRRAKPERDAAEKGGQVVMDRARFWAMIQTAKAASGREIGRQTTRLQRELGGLPLAQIVGFQRILEQLHADSCAENRPRYLDRGPLLRLRGWLIAQGQHVYEAAVADPDSLADYADLQTDWPPGALLPWYWGEWLWAVALNAYGDRTGEEIPGLAGWPAGLIGTWWAAEENQADLHRRYPRLWARFHRQ
jgi:Protein of unknown function (DUF4240)